jgi:hypothetical protein
MRAVVGAVAWVLLSGCASSQAQPDAPAVIVNPSAQSRAALVAAVTHALGIADVAIADDALSTDSTLIVERTRIVDSNGHRLNGRELGKPESFQLVKSGEQCILVHTRTAARQILANTNCRRQ